MLYFSISSYVQILNDLKDNLRPLSDDSSSKKSEKQIKFNSYF